MTTPAHPTPIASNLEQLSSPSSRAGSAAHPVTQLAQNLSSSEEIFVVLTMQLSIASPSSHPGGFAQAEIPQATGTGEHLEGIEPLGARKVVEPSPVSSETTASKPVVDVAEEKLRATAATASEYLPSPETQQHALDTTKRAFASTSSAAMAGAMYAGHAITSGAQAAFGLVQPHLPETLGGPHNPANDSTVAEDLDDIVTRAAEAKQPVGAEKKAITAEPDITTVGKEQEPHFDVSRSHPEPALDTQQPGPAFTESPSTTQWVRAWGSPRVRFGAAFDP